MKTLSLVAIKKAMAEKNISSQKELRRQTKLSQSTITRLFKGTLKPEAETVETLARTLGLTHAQLYGEVADQPRETPMDLEKPVFIEIRGKVWATPFRISREGAIGQYIRGLPGEQGCFALQVEGNSMEPHYNPGDYVICRPRRAELTPYSEADDAPVYVPYDQMIQFHNRDAVVEHNEEIMLKRIQIERRGGTKYAIHMISLNEKYPRVTVHFGDVWKMVAVVIRKQMPEISE